MMQIDVDLVQLVVLSISLNLKKKKNYIINVLNKNISIFVLIDLQSKNCDCRIIMISNTVFIFKTHALK